MTTEAIATFTASFFLLSSPTVPVIHVVGYRSVHVCRLDAARIARNIRLPGGIKIGVRFECALAGNR